MDRNPVDTINATVRHAGNAGQAVREREYSIRRAAGITGLPAEQIRRWARAGFVGQRRRPRAHWRLSFRDLALLKTMRSLRDAGFSFNRATRTLRTARDQLRPGSPLSAVGVLVRDGRIILRDRASTWEPRTRQATFDFSVGASSRPHAAMIGYYAC